MKNRLIKNSPCSLLDKPKYWNWGFAQTRFVASGDIGILVDGVSVGLLCTDHSYEQFRASSVFLPLGQRNLRTV
jgi:hypothetical protein